MKHAFKFLLLITLPILLMSASRPGSLPKKVIIHASPTDSIAINSLVNISRKDFEKKLGRKLGLLERIALKKVKKKYKKEPGWVMDDRKVPIEAILSDVFAIGGFYAFVAGVGAGFQCDDNCPEWATPVAVIGFLAIILGGILGIIALAKILKNKEKWKGVFFAIVGIVILVGLLALLVAI